MHYSWKEHPRKCFVWRWRNTRHITPNLSRNIDSLQALGRCFAFFTLRDHLVADWRNTERWLVDLPFVDPRWRHLLRDKVWVKISCTYPPRVPNYVRRGKLLMKNEQQRQNLLFKVDPRSTFSQHFSLTRNKCFCCVTSWGFYLSYFATRIVVENVSFCVCVCWNWDGTYS